MFSVKNYFNTTFDQKTKKSVIVNGTSRFGNHPITGSLSDLAELATLKDDSYHIRINAEEDVVFFGDLDHYKNSFRFENFLNDLSADLEIKKDDIKYTLSEKENEYSYHFSVPKVQTNLETLKMFFNNAKYGKSGYDVDLSVYSNKWFRLPNQTNEQKPIKHNIINGKMKHFIINNVENCKYTYYDKPKQEPTPIKAKTPAQYEEVEAYVNMLSYSRAEEYNDWIQVGLCLHNILGEESRNLFHTFSKQWDDYKKNNVDKQFNTFKEKEHGGLTMGTLKYWAKEDNPEEYHKYNKTNSKMFWSIMKELNQLNVAEYYKKENDEDQKYIYCNEQWYKFNKFNLIEKLGSKNPTCLFNDIATKLQRELKQELNNFDIETSEFQYHYKIFKPAYKSVGTNKFVDGVIGFLKGLYNDSTLEDKLDNDQNLLSFSNMLYDYKIKKFRDIKKSDYVSFNTQYNAPTKSNPKIREELNKLLSDIFEKEDIIKYWRQSISMAMFTNKYESVYIHTGSGGNGKGLLFTLLKYCMGDYFKQADNEFLTTKFKSNAPNSTLANSKGKRFFIVSEPSSEDTDKNAEAKLNVDFIKYISGGDEISCRDLYKTENKSFKPLFTCFMQCNDKPKLSKLDKGILRRLKIVDYPFNFKNQEDIKYKTDKLIDVNLKDKLKNQDYINEFMLMLLETAQEGVITEPKQVKESVEEYATDNDPIKGWLLESYEILEDDVKPSERIKTSIMADYCPIKLIPSKFNQYLKNNGIRIKQIAGYNWLLNVKQIIKKDDLDL